MASSSSRATVCGEVAVVGLDHPHVAELALVPEERQRVLGRDRRPLGQQGHHPGVRRRGAGEQQPRLAQQVQRDVGQGDVLLQVRGPAAPLA